MTDEIRKDELLTEEQLNEVSGGTNREDRIDRRFFFHLGYRDAREAGSSAIENMFLAEGIKYDDGGDYSNTYKILTADGWCAHPQWAALGYILAQRRYPGFNGNWTDKACVTGFLKKEFHMYDCTFK